MSTDYFGKLGPPAQNRYIEKLEVIGNTDPHSAPGSDFSVRIGDFPSICYPDIVNYLVLAREHFLLMT